MRYRLAIFDFDGTLADSFACFLRIVNRLADEHRFRRIEEHEIDTLRGQAPREIVKHLGFPLWKLPRIGRQMRQQMAGELGGICLFPGVDRLLRELAGGGVRLAIVTSNSVDNVRAVLGRDNAALIGHYACGASIFGKRTKFRAVLRDSGVPAAEAIAIGDEIRDLQAAHAAGIDFGAVSWGFACPEALRAHAPRETFSSPDEILQKLLEPGDG